MLVQGSEDASWLGLVTMGKVADSPAVLLLAGKQKGSPDPFQYPEPWIPVLWGCWKGAEGEQQFWLSWHRGCRLSWFEHCDDVWEDWDFEDDFYFPVHINEISGVVQAENVTVITAENQKEKRGKDYCFLICLTKIEVWIYYLESARWIPWRKWKSVHKESVFCGFVSLFSGNPHAKHPGSVGICLPV